MVNMIAAMDVRLRDVSEADLPILFEQQSDPEASRMAAFPARDREAFFAHELKIQRDPRAVRRTILAGEEIAGSIGSWEADGLRLVGYMLGRSYWGKGIATQALAQLLEVVTTRPLHALVAKHNVGSIRVLEKNGFTIVREETSHEHGMVVEELLMRLG
jgi:RimJ/RimL family protein N-acetyltransferase